MQRRLSVISDEVTLGKKWTQVFAPVISQRTSTWPFTSLRGLAWHGGVRWIGLANETEDRGGDPPRVTPEAPKEPISARSCRRLTA